MNSQSYAQFAWTDEISQNARLNCRRSRMLGAPYLRSSDMAYSNNLQSSPSIYPAHNGLENNCDGDDSRQLTEEILSNAQPFPQQRTGRRIIFESYLPTIHENSVLTEDATFYSLNTKMRTAYSRSFAVPQEKTSSIQSTQHQSEAERVTGHSTSRIKYKFMKLSNSGLRVQDQDAAHIFESVSKSGSEINLNATRMVSIRESEFDYGIRLFIALLPDSYELMIKNEFSRNGVACSSLGICSAGDIKRCAFNLDKLNLPSICYDHKKNKALLMQGSRVLRDTDTRAALLAQFRQFTDKRS
jgi:hypothetical protein